MKTSAWILGTLLLTSPVHAADQGRGAAAVLSDRQISGFAFGMYRLQQELAQFGRERGPGNVIRVTNFETRNTHHGARTAGNVRVLGPSPRSRPRRMPAGLADGDTCAAACLERLPMKAASGPPRLRNRPSGAPRADSYPTR